VLLGQIIEKIGTTDITTIDITRPIRSIITRRTMAMLNITKSTNITALLTIVTDGKSITAITIKNIDIIGTAINIIAPITGMIITTIDITMITMDTSIHEVNFILGP
jgi:hypothetical protein